MHLVRHTLRDFRNIAHAELTLCPGLNVLHGENGQGKTNFLESIFCLATHKALRGSRLSELVRLGAERARIEGVVDEEGVSTRLTMTLEAGRREARIDGKAARSVERWSEHLKVVAFTPDDLEVAKGSPSARRRWLDRATFTRFPAYLAEHRRYGRALKARNRLLREGARTGRLPAELGAFDEGLVEAGARLLTLRLALLEELAASLPALHQEVTGTALGLQARYRATGLPEGVLDRTEPGALADALREALTAALPADRARAHTTVGPHTDDLLLRLEERELRSFGSQGQQRAVVLSLKIAEIENLRRQTGLTPVLLLDDVSSELDPERNAHLLAYLAGFEGQVVLTTTDPSHAPIPPQAPALRVQVRAGTLTPE